MASTASCSPCHRGRPLQTTSIRRASCTGTSRFMSASRTFLATRAPASRHTPARARSRGMAREARTPAVAHAVRWSPSTSSGLRQAQARVASGSGRRNWKCALGSVTSSCVGRNIRAREECGPACDSSSAREAGDRFEKAISNRARHRRGQHVAAIHGDGHMGHRVWRPRREAASPPPRCLRACRQARLPNTQLCTLAPKATRRLAAPVAAPGALSRRTGSASHQDAQCAAWRSVRAQRKPRPPKRAARRCQQQRVVRLAEEPGKARRNVVLGSVKGRFCRGQNAEEVIGAQGSAVAQQKPCRLKILDCGDGLQQTIVGLPFQRELALDKRVRPERRAQDIEALLVTGQCPAPDPNWFTPAGWRSRMSAGSAPAAFQIRVLARFSCTRAWVHSAPSTAAYSSLTRSGDATM